MYIRDLKYLAAYIIPVLVGMGLYLGGLYSYAAFIFAFVLVPLIEPLLSSSKSNLTEEEKSNKLASLFFDFLLLLNLPLVYILLYVFALQVKSGGLSSFEVTGLVLSLGTLLGACGINVAHELGHKESKLYKLFAFGLLIPSFYAHFTIEHNRGHHKNVATPKDPATSKKNEPVYLFWVRSIVGTYKNAWILEFNRLQQKGRSRWHYTNLMYVFTVAPLIYIAMVFFAFGSQAMIWLGTIGIISFIFLETINYIEHYGLERKLLASGRYERVLPKHSWNSNHYLGRIILYELTRHSDHHYLANKKYQVLDHHNESPQLPFGYPTSMLISLIPPIWFRIMNPRLVESNNS